MKRRILLVDDEVAVLLTLKAVLEINGFDVDTAASGREGRLKLRSHEYHMVISDMRMENDAGWRGSDRGSEVSAVPASGGPAYGLPLGRRGLAGDGRRSDAGETNAHASSAGADRSPDGVAQSAA